MVKKFFSLFAALTLSAGLFAKTSIITYTAEEKLPETTSMYGNGLHTNAFYAADSTQLTVTHTFDEAEGVGTITLDGEVAIIGDCAFYRTSLTSVTIPEGVTTIGESAFYVCSALQSITIPESVTSIGETAFYKTGLTSITIPAGVTEIGEHVFNQCASLASVTLPEGVTTIGEYAFYICSSLQSVTIPASVTTIGSQAFTSCTGLTSVTFLGNACQEGIANDAFAYVGNPDPALLTLPNSWTGTLPDDQGKWYGGKFELSSIPTALPNVNANANVNVNKFMHNGQLLIRKDGKNYNVLGGRVK